MNPPRVVLGVAGSLVALHAATAAVAADRPWLLVAAASALALWWWAVRRLGPRMLGGVAVAAGLVAVIAGLGISVAELAHGRHVVEDATGLVGLVAGLLMVVLGCWLVLRGRRWWAWVVAAPVALLALYWVVVPLVVATMATRSGHGPPSARTPAAVGLDFEEQVLHTGNGVRLAAWWIPGTNGAAVVVRHGASSERAGALDQAAVLADAGFSVLVMDARGHGASGGSPMRFGWGGAAEIAAGVDFVLGQPEVELGVGVLGLSMGGEEALTAAAGDPRIGAVVAEGATVRTTSDFLGIDKGVAMWLSAPHFWVMYSAADVLSPASPPMPLREAVSRIAPRPVLLITAGEVADEGTFAQRYRSAAPATTQVWEVEGAGHTQGLDTDPDGWRDRVVALFEEALVSVEP